MPTAYTEALYDREDQSFEDFLLNCARAMGACIMQRDDPMCVAPKKVEPSDYHIRRIAETIEELERLKAMPIDEAEEEARIEREAALREREEHDKNALDLLGRYHRMLSAVKEWKPPTPDHIGLQEFMIEQLETSINFVCSTGDWSKIPPIVSGEEWRSNQIKKMLRSLDYNTRENLREIERTDGRNRWIEELYVSIGRSSI